MVVTEAIGPPSLTFMGKIQASVCYFGKKYSQSHIENYLLNLTQDPWNQRRKDLPLLTRYSPCVLWRHLSKVSTMAVQLAMRNESWLIGRVSRQAVTPGPVLPSSLCVLVFRVRPKHKAYWDSTTDLYALCNTHHEVILLPVWFQWTGCRWAWLGKSNRRQACGLRFLRSSGCSSKHFIIMANFVVSKDEWDLEGLCFTHTGARPTLVCPRA